MILKSQQPRDTIKFIEMKQANVSILKLQTCKISELYLSADDLMSVSIQKQSWELKLHFLELMVRQSQTVHFMITMGFLRSVDKSQTAFKK